MKKIMISVAAMLLVGISYGQKDLVSTVFEKYAGTEGVTTVNVSGDMLKLFTQAEQDKSETDFTSSLSEIKILATDKGCDKPVSIDFRSEVYNKLDKGVYKEMVSVKNTDEDVVIMMKESNGRIAEIIIIAGGKGENALIQVKGDMLLNEMAEMAGKYQMKGFDQLKKLEN